MIEETAQVVRVDSSGVWVETGRRTTCSSCSVQKGCGTATLSRVLGQRRTLVRVLAGQNLSAGDQVVIAIDERAVVRGSLAVYAVPIVLLLLGALLGELGAQQGLWQSAELASIGLGLSGLAGGLFWLRRFTHNIEDNDHYQPVVLRKLNTAAMGAVESL